MALKIPVAHDFICPWCWVGVIQARRLSFELGVEFDWLGYELFPDELDWPDYSKYAQEHNPNKPPTPSRFDFILLADEITMPAVERPHQMRTHNAHEAVEYAKTKGKGVELIERLYWSLWREGKNINDPEVLAEIAAPILGDVTELKEVLATRKFKDNIVGFDDDAYSKGIYNVPTFFIGEKRYAEQPFAVLSKAIKEVLNAG